MSRFDKKLYNKIDSEELETFLAARRLLYALFQNIFGNEPTVEQFKAVSLPIVREAFAIFGVDVGCKQDSSNCATADSLCDFCSLLNSLSERTNIIELQSEYMRLFIGPGRIPAPPWESVYISGERLIFQQTTLDVRNFYRSQGFIPELYPRVADDHIALELDFLAHLATRALEQNNNQSVSYTEALMASYDFIGQHLLKWLPFFLERLLKQDENTPAFTIKCFYLSAASQTLAFVKKDYELLNVYLNNA